MDFKTSRKLCSVPRMGKYASACGGDKLKTMQLYRYNLRLCQRFYGVLNLFEVMLRNAVNHHYVTYYTDSDWIVHRHYQLIRDYILYLGYEPKEVLWWAEKPDAIIEKIEKMNR